MKKSTIMLVTVLFMIIGYAAYNATVNIYGLGKISENISDFKVYLDNLKVNDTESTGINSAKDEFTIDNINGNISVDIVNDSTEYDTESYLECESIITPDKTEWTFDYTGSEQTFIAPVSGTYKLETWGAQGGSGVNTNKESNQNTWYVRSGGYGGYSSGKVYFLKSTKIYLNIGGTGSENLSTQVSGAEYSGGFNGGGNGIFYSAGGGATHIAMMSGLLSSLENNKDEILIVSGGGAGTSAHYLGGGFCIGGSGGGIEGQAGLIGNSSSYLSNGSTQTSGYAFGQGESSIKTSDGYGTTGGGGGYFGGLVPATFSSSWNTCSGGGSGYIGNTLLTEKSMYCYNCTESSEESTKTISTTCTSATPTANCAKSGNGYARITLVSNSKENISTDPITIEAQNKKTITLENINTGSMTCKLKVNKISRTEKAYTGPTEWTFDYTGSEQTFIAPVSGTYKLETWGAQGGSIGNYTGGYGGYSAGNIEILAKQQLYVAVGEIGKYSTWSTTTYPDNPSYNGGGAGFSGGGGATHIAMTSGLLRTFENNLSELLIVSGGGGGGKSYGDSTGNYSGNGGSGGGYIGGDGIPKNSIVYGYGTGGSQTSGGYYKYITSSNGASYGSFGNGAVVFVPHGAVYLIGAGGGGGFYGGGSIEHGPAGGGSGYIGNTLLTEKSMYCNNCTESTEEATKTISTTCTSATPTANCAKQGNGYARITLIN